MKDCYYAIIISFIICYIIFGNLTSALLYIAMMTPVIAIYYIAFLKED